MRGAAFKSTSVSTYTSHLHYCSNPRLGNLCIFSRFHAGHTDGADTMTFDDDGNATFEHAINFRRAQERYAATIDDFFINARLATAHGGSLGLRWSEVRGNRRHAIHALQPQQVAAVIDDGDRHRPVVLDRFRFGGSSDFLYVVQGQNRFRLHETSLLC